MAVGQSGRTVCRGVAFRAGRGGAVLPALLTALVALSSAAPLRADSKDGEIDLTTVGEILRGHLIVHTFTADDDYLDEITLGGATFGRKNTCRLHVRLQDEAGVGVCERYLDCSNLQDNAPISLKFPPQAGSKNRRYCVLVNTADARQGNAVTLRVVRPAPRESRLTVGKQAVRGGICELHYRYAQFPGYLAKWRRTLVLWAGLYALLGLGAFLAAARHVRAGQIPAGRLRDGWTHDTFRRAAALLWGNRIEFGFLAGILLVFLLAAPSSIFSDEQDNILDGLFINRGMLPYRDFFSSHMPFPHYFAAIITALTGPDMWAFRSVFLTAIFLWSACNYALIRRHVSRPAAVLYLLLSSLSMMSYNGHMILADTFIAHAGVTLLLLLLFRFRAGRVISLGDVACVSLLTAVIVFSSLGWVYFSALIYLGFAFRYFGQKTWARGGAGRWAALAVLAAPYLLLAVQLVVTHSLKGFLDNNLVFNSRYQGQFNSDIQANPLLCLGRIFARFVEGVHACFYEPASRERHPIVFCLLAALGLSAWLAHQARWRALAFFLLALVLTSPRNGIGNVWNDCHHHPFILTCILAGSVAVAELPRALKAAALPHAAAAVYFLLLPFAASTLAWSAAYSFEVYYNYLNSPKNCMMTDAGDVGGIVNELVSRDDYAWIAPYDVHIAAQVRAKPPTYYHFLLPCLAIIDGSKERVLRDLETNRPSVIYWRPEMFETDDYCPEVLAYIELKYFRIEHPKREPYAFRYLHFAKEKRAEVLEKLVRLGYVDRDEAINMVTDDVRSRLVEVSTSCAREALARRDAAPAE